MADDQNIKTDPQQLVDDALGGSSAATKPSGASEEGAATAVNQPTEEKMQAIPPELLSPSPEAGATESQPAASMGDDTPLAFAAAPATPSAPNGAMSSAPSTPPMPEMPQMAEPPTGPKFPDPTKSAVPLPPAGGMPATPPPKKGGKLGKVLLTLFGFLLLVGGIAGGYWYYTNYYGETPQIAVLDQACYDRCRVNKGHQVCTCECGGECTRPDSSGGGTGPTDSKVACTGTPNKDYFQCGVVTMPDGSKCGGFCVNGVSKTCDQWLQQECNYTQTYGASCATASGGKFTFPCDCGGTLGTVYFDKTGYCNSTDAAEAGVKDPSYYDTYGLCAAAKGGCSGTDPSGNVVTKYTCDNNGCSVKAEFYPAYWVGKYTCDGPVSGGNGCQPNTPGAKVEKEFPVAQSYTFDSGLCDKTQQIDVATNGVPHVDSRSRYFPPCDEPSEPPTTTTPTPSPSPSPTPTPTPKPTLACTGLTKNLADSAIKVGSEIEFTCAGASTPTGAVTLNYQFRLRRDSGAWQSLPVTGAKASYEIEEIGDYDVQCRACGTIDNASVCDPEWGTASI